MEEMGLKLLLETAGGAKVEETKGCWVVEKGWTLGTDVAWSPYGQMGCLYCE